MFARNMGWITGELFDALVAWHSLLIIIGVYTLLHRHYVSGCVLLLIGVYLLMGGLTCLPENSQAMVWPLALVLAGILFLIKGGSRRQSARQRIRRHVREGMRENIHEHVAGQAGRSNETDTGNGTETDTENGFLRSNNVFGAARHVVLDEIFKGASIRTSFGGTTIDLRHTRLAPGETYIDLECSCGGVEIFVPADWKVVITCNAFFGGCEDKRWQGANTNRECTLVIRGNVSFGGLEIKD